MNMTINLWVKVSVFSADRPKWTGLITANAKERLHSCTCQKKEREREKRNTEKKELINLICLRFFYEKT